MSIKVNVTFLDKGINIFSTWMSPNGGQQISVQPQYIDIKTETGTLLTKIQNGTNYSGQTGVRLRCDIYYFLLSGTTTLQDYLSFNFILYGYANPFYYYINTSPSDVDNLTDINNTITIVGNKILEYSGDGIPISNGSLRISVPDIYKTTTSPAELIFPRTINGLIVNNIGRRSNSVPSLAKDPPYNLSPMYYGKGPTEDRQTFVPVFDIANTTTIKIPYNIRTIGQSVFCPESFTRGINPPGLLFGLNLNSDKLKRVELPDSLQTIDTEAFFKCKNLDTINFPSSLKYIGNYSFSQTKLSNIDLSLCNDLRDLKFAAFSDCNSGPLNNIILPSGVNSYIDSPAIFDRSNYITNISVQGTGKYFSNNNTIYATINPNSALAPLLNTTSAAPVISINTNLTIPPQVGNYVIDNILANFYPEGYSFTKLNISESYIRILLPSSLEAYNSTSNIVMPSSLVDVRGDIFRRNPYSTVSYARPSSIYFLGNQPAFDSNIPNSLSYDAKFYRLSNKTWNSSNIYGIPVVISVPPPTPTLPPPTPTATPIPPTPTPTIPPTPPGVVQNFTTTSVAGGISCSWSAPSSAGNAGARIISYILQVRNPSNIDDLNNLNYSTSSTSFSFSFPALSVIGYNVSIAAVNSNNLVSNYLTFFLNETPPLPSPTNTPVPTATPTSTPGPTTSPTPTATLPPLALQEYLTFTIPNGPKIIDMTCSDDPYDISLIAGDSFNNGIWTEEVYIKDIDTWTKPLMPPSDGSIRYSSISSFNNNSGLLIAGTKPSGGFPYSYNSPAPVYLTADKGNNWKNIGSNTRWLQVVSSSSGAVVAALSMSSSPSELYVYTATGDPNDLVNTIGDLTLKKTFTLFSINLASSKICISDDGTKIVVAVYGGAVWLSEDSGENWTSKFVNAGWTQLACSSDCSKIAAWDDGNYRLFLSNNTGNTYSIISSNKIKGNYPHNIRMDVDLGRCTRRLSMSKNGQNLVLLVFDSSGNYAIFYSRDGGNNWFLYKQYTFGGGIVKLDNILYSGDGSTIFYARGASFYEISTARATPTPTPTRTPTPTPTPTSTPGPTPTLNIQSINISNNIELLSYPGTPTYISSLPGVVSNNVQSIISIKNNSVSSWRKNSSFNSLILLDGASTTQSQGYLVESNGSPYVFYNGPIIDQTTINIQPGNNIVKIKMGAKNNSINNKYFLGNDGRGGPGDIFLTSAISIENGSPKSWRSNSSFNSLKYLENGKTYLLQSRSDFPSSITTLYRFLTNSANIGSPSNNSRVGSSGRSSYYGTYDQTGTISSDIVSLGSQHYYVNVADGNSPYSFIFDSRPVVNDQARSTNLRIAGSIEDPFTEFVFVGDVGNTGIVENMSNMVNYRGDVNYTYYIQKYKLTVAEYCVFLNSIYKSGEVFYQGKQYFFSDTLDPFAPGEVIRAFSSFKRTGIKGAYVYEPDNLNNADNTMIWSTSTTNNTSSEFFQVAALINWLDNGKNDGDLISVLNGVYDLTSSNPVKQNINPVTNLPPKFWIPTANEWIKAGFYKGNGTNSGYWKTSVMSDTKTTLDPGYLDS